MTADQPGQPVISIIIAHANSNGLQAFIDCLAALIAQPGNLVAEVVVADATNPHTQRAIAGLFPTVKLLALPGTWTIPQLRCMALAASSGEIVAVLEDHCIVNQCWAATIVRTFQAYPEIVAVGGAVENDLRDRTVDWATFFCEYAAFMPPLERGVKTRITGNNVAYRRSALEDIEDLDVLLRRGFWESTLHPTLLARGGRLFQEPDMLVRHRQSFGICEFLRQRYLYSRYYAGIIAAGAPATSPVRLLRAAGSLLLPPLLVARIASAVKAKRRYRKELQRSLPLLVAFTCAWAIGEMAGALLGPGSSLEQIV